ncbi:MAG: DUF1028 domain-containing protein [Enhydrobacter sp.]
MTFSISGRCSRTGMFGIAVSSSSPAVAARCAHVAAGVGVVASQNITDPRLGHSGLRHLADGKTAEQTIAAIKAEAGSTADYRQLACVDGTGLSFAFTGAKALGINGHHLGQNAVAAGNLLANDAVPRGMVERFLEHSERHLGERLMATLERAMELGGEAGPVRSAGMLVVDKMSWPLVDLRVDWDDSPIGKLRELWTVWQPQMMDYVTRGLDPTRAPSYGVPGDL